MKNDIKEDSMHKIILQKAIKFFSIGISAMFCILFFLYILGNFWLWFDISSIKDSSLQNILKFKLCLSVILSLVCLSSLFVKKKIMMIIWILSLLCIEKSYGIFPQYKQYMAYTDCIDSSKVWDYNEHRCRTDCWKWDTEHGCYKIE